MAEIGVDCLPGGDGWRCVARVAGPRSSTDHVVTVGTADLARLDPGAAEPSDLVLRSFAFLLEREPNESILRTFDLTVICRYFPEWEAEIRGRA